VGSESRPAQRCAPADQSRHRDGVVRSPEWRHGEQPLAPLEAAARTRSSSLDGLSERHGGQQSGQPERQHGLAGAGRPSTARCGRRRPRSRAPSFAVACRVLRRDRVTAGAVRGGWRGREREDSFRRTSRRLREGSGRHGPAAPARALPRERWVRGRSAPGSRAGAPPARMGRTPRTGRTSPRAPVSHHHRRRSQGHQAAARGSRRMGRSNATPCSAQVAWR